MYRTFWKRFFDIVLSLTGILLLALPMLIIAILVKLDSKGPVLFRQERLGAGAKPFSILKFRSMRVGAEHTGSGVYSGKDDDRVTRLGRILRKTSLDELPQLFNILKGEMSLVGPRPPLTYHPWTVDRYTSEQLHMFDALPGITGWAQIHGRKGVEWNYRIELNNWYVDHMSLGLDLKILFLTVFKVLSAEDNENTGATVQTPAAEENHTPDKGE